MRTINHADPHGGRGGEDGGAVNLFSHFASVLEQRGGGKEESEIIIAGWRTPTIRGVWLVSSVLPASSYQIHNGRFAAIK